MADRAVARADVDRADKIIASGAKTVFTNKKKTAHEGSVTETGNSITQGAQTVFVENKRIARAGDNTARSVPVVAGSTNVFAGDNVGTSKYIRISQPDIALPPSEKITTALQAKWNTTIPANQGGSVALPDTDAPPVNAPPLQAGQAKDIKSLLDQILAESTNWTRGNAPQGPGGNQNIVGLFKDLGCEAWSMNEKTAWCAAFVNFVLKNTGYKYTRDLGVKSFYSNPSKWGAEIVYKTGGYGNWQAAAPGDICVWDYGGAAAPTCHVNFVYANLGSQLQLCGGNQSGKAPNNNNPSGSSVTNGSKWSPAIDRPGSYRLMMIMRPVKR